MSEISVVVIGKLDCSELNDSFFDALLKIIKHELEIDKHIYR